MRFKKIALATFLMLININAQDFLSAYKIKMYIDAGRVANVSDADLIRIYSKVGSDFFSELSYRNLERQNKNFFEYIKIVKMFQSKQYRDVLKYSNNFKTYSILYPIILHMRAVSLTLIGKAKDAQAVFRKCSVLSEKFKDKFDSVLSEKLRLNSQMCDLGLARTQYEVGNTQDSIKGYLEFSKSSPLWPQTLVEVAWGFYRESSYNYSLGKLVTYNAPVMKPFFMNDLFVLQALNHLGLCKYDYVEKIVERYQDLTERELSGLKKYISRNKGRYEALFQDLLNEESLSVLTRRIVLNFKRKNIYRSRIKIFELLNDEIKKYGQKREYSDIIRFYRSIIGGRFYKDLILNYKSLKQSVKGMSYIKLELLDRKKRSLLGKSKNYNTLNKTLNIEYDYLWDFRGEFWADELGDFVYRYDSRCN